MRRAAAFGSAVLVLGALVTSFQHCVSSGSARRQSREPAAAPSLTISGASVRAPFTDGLGAGLFLPFSKQGTGEARVALSSADMDARYRVLSQLGLGYRQYNFWWSELENSGVTSSMEPLHCPAGHRQIPANENEKQAMGYLRYRCVNESMLRRFDELIRRDTEAGMQSGVVLWSSAPQYRHARCEGFNFNGVQLPDGCVPRDDAMDDFEDFVRLVAARYRGPERGKISHFIIWNENASPDWFDMSPTVSRHALDNASVTRRLDKYADMMRRAYRGLSRVTQGVMLFAGTDSVWEPNPSVYPGHMGSRRLLEGLWARLGTEIPWSVAVHPYGEPAQPAAGGHYSFNNLEIVSQYQANQLRQRGITNVAGMPQYYLIASEQGWPQRLGIREQARAVCQAHQKAMRMPELVAVAHNYFHSVEPQEQQSGGHSGQGEFFGILPYSVRDDLGNMLEFATGQAYQSTSSLVWGRRNDHYCCQNHQLGCQGSSLEAGSLPSPSILGHFDGLQRDADGFVLTGWACQPRVPRRLNIHVYASGGPGQSTALANVPTEVAHEAAVAQACGGTDIPHRFRIRLDNATWRRHSEQALHVYGVLPFDAGSALLEGSGNHLLPLWQEPSVPGPEFPPGSLAPLHRYYSTRNQDHRVTTVQVASTYRFESTLGSILVNSRDGTVALQECRAGGRDHFLSRNPDCEGQQRVGRLGYLFEQPRAGARALFRCVTQHGVSHFASHDENCEGQRAEGLLGYLVDEPQAPPPPPPASPAGLELRRYIAGVGRDHRITTGSVGGGYREEALLGRVLEEPADEESRALYECLVGDWDYLLSTDPGCEGQTTIGLLGYVHPGARPGTRALYRCQEAGSGDHFASQDSACEGQLREGLLGYIAE